MQMLMGQHKCAMDAKGRLNFPARLREELGEQFVITKGMDNSLIAFTMQGWEAFSARFEEKSMAEKRKLERVFFGAAVLASPDKQGRILLPGNLREYARLEKDVVVSGVRDRVEIWNAEDWAVAEAMDNESMEAAMLETRI